MTPISAPLPATWCLSHSGRSHDRGPRTCRPLPAWRLPTTLYTSAERDGSTIGAFPNDIPMDPLFGNPGARYDAQKLNWLGSIGKLENVCATWITQPDQDHRARRASAK